MTHNEKHEIVFRRLKESLQKHERRLSVQADSPLKYYLNGPKPDAKGKSVFFGAVLLKKSYVSYHLMPVYMFPELLDGLTPELKGRMQGKSCFNFKQWDEALFCELDALTKKAFQRFKSEGFV